MINVFIHGSCVSRGVFDYAKSDGAEKKFNVIEYIAKNSIFSLWGNPIQLSFPEECINPKDLDWNTRMVFLDSKKQVLDRIKCCKADIFVIDLIDERLRRLVIAGDYSRVITYSESFARGEYIKLLDNYEMIDFDAAGYFESYDVIFRYCEYIKRFYREDQIFIIEAFPVLTYYDKNKEMQVFNNNTIASGLRLTRQLEMYYGIIKECLPHANYIKFPRNVCGSEKHKFGLSNVHYESMYYNYVLAEVVRHIPLTAFK